MKKLFENWNKYLGESVNESIGVGDREMLFQTLRIAYEGMVTSHNPDAEQRITDDKGNVSYRKVDPDPHVEARYTLLNLVEDMVNEIQGKQRGEKDVGQNE